MKQSTLFALWGGLFVLCAGLGFIPEPEGVVGVMSTFASILFFLPPALLYGNARKAGDKQTLKLLRNLAAAALGAAMVLLIVNFLSLAASETLGNLLYTVFIIATSPMVCSGYWFLPLFLWACLLITCQKALKKTG